jgi:hypothetical protein
VGVTNDLEIGWAGLPFRSSGYNTTMIVQKTLIMEEMLEPLSAAMTPETAKVLSRLQAKPSMQARIDELASRCNQGTLTVEERAEYETYNRVGNLFAISKATAKRLNADSPHG